MMLDPQIKDVLVRLTKLFIACIIGIGLIVYLETKNPPPMVENKSQILDLDFKNVIVYSTPSCSYCFAAKRLLDKKNIRYEEIDVSEDPKLREEMVAKAFDRRTVPQIFFGSTHVGGHDDLVALERQGALDKNNP